MAFTAVNVGAAPNDGTGDTIRAAFQTVNANFVKCRVSATADPTVNDDSNDGYEVGTLWFNSASGMLFICRDATAAAAIWRCIRVGQASTPYVAGRWYPGFRGTVVSGAGYGTAARMRLFPFMPRQRVTISDLGINVTSADAGKNAQLAIYLGNKATGRPTGSQLNKTGNVTVASSGFQSAAMAAAVTCEPGELYFFGVNSDSTAAQFRTYDAVDTFFIEQIGSTTGSDALAGSGTLAHHVYTDVATYSTWGDLTSATFTLDTTSRCPGIAYKVSNVP